MGNKQPPLDINGTKVDFSAIATDNIPESSVDNRILEEKVSFLLFKEFLNGKLSHWLSNNNRSFERFSRLGPSVSFYSYVKQDLLYSKLDDLISVLDKEASKLDFGKCDGINYYRTIMPDNEMFLPRKIENAIDCNNLLMNRYHQFFNPKNRDFGYEEEDPNNLYKPRQKWVPYWHNYIGDFKTIPLVFRFDDGYGHGDMFIFKCYEMENHHFVKRHYPLSIFRIKNVFYWAVIPRTDQQHLFQLDKIAKASTVVLCTSLEDAWALQNSNSNCDGDIVFTDSVFDEYEQVDFSPLKGKNVYILISNHSSNTLAESYLEIDELVTFLEKKGINIISFVQREIEYPSIENLWDYNSLLTRYKAQPPQIKESSFLVIDRQSFKTNLDAARAEINRKKQATVDLPFYLSQTKEKEKNNSTDKGGDRFKNMLVRSLLAKRDISMLYGPSKIGKSIFAIALCGLYASKSASKKSVVDGMAFTRCYIDNRKQCAVYVAFDNNVVNNFDLYRKSFADSKFGHSECFQLINAVGKANEYYKDCQNLVEHINNSVNNNEVGLIVIDKLTALSKECYADAIQEYSQKLLAFFPDVAILWIHHSNENKKPSGGNSVTGVPTFLISIDHDAKDGKNLHLKLEGNQLYLDEEKDVTICIQKNTFTLVSPTRSEDEMKELVLEAYSNKNGAFRMNQNDAAKLLGYSDASAFRKKDSAIKTTSRKKTRTAGKK